MNYQLAQLNIGRIKAQLDSEVMKGFVDRLDDINALADKSPGFIWRLQSEEGDATAFRPFPDDMLLVNMSVWQDVDALHNYTYHTAHAKLLRDRKEWFEHIQEAFMVLWWIPAGHIPNLQEAKERLDALRRDGPTAYAFTFKQRFEPPEE